MGIAKKLSLVGLLLVSQNLNAFNLDEAIKGAEQYANSLISGINLGEMGELGDVLKNILESQSIEFNNEFLSAKCKTPKINDDPFSGICGDVVKEPKSKMRSLLNRKFKIGGICEIGFNGKTKSDANDKMTELENYCKELEKETEEIKTTSNRPYEKLPEATRKKVQKEVKNRVSTPRSVLINAERHLPLLGGDFHSENKDANTSLNQQKNVFGEVAAKRIDTLSTIHNGLVDSVANSAGSDFAAEVTMDCLSKFPVEEISKSEESLQFYFDICSPKNIERPSPVEVTANIIDTAKIIAQEYVPNYATSLETQVQISAEIFEKCSTQTTLQSALTCEQAYLNQEEDSAIATTKALEASYIKTIEENGANTMQLLNEIYPKKIKDTSQKALENIPSNQRAYFLAQASRQDKREALVSSYMLRITEAKKELTRLSFAKIKECSAPFYASAVLSEIDKMVNDSEAKAKEIVDKILNGN